MENGCSNALSVGVCEPRNDVGRISFGYRSAKLPSLTGDQPSHLALTPPTKSTERNPIQREPYDSEVSRIQVWIWCRWVCRKLLRRDSRQLVLDFRVLIG